MQGTFDPLPVSRQLDTPAASRQPEREDQGRKLKSESKESKDSKEYKEFLQFKQAKRSHLDALENVPWSNMAPANDKDTQRRMRQHRNRTGSSSIVPCLTHSCHSSPRSPHTQRHRIRCFLGCLATNCSRMVCTDMCS